MYFYGEAVNDEAWCFSGDIATGDAQGEMSYTRSYAMLPPLLVICLPRRVPARRNSSCFRLLLLLLLLPLPLMLSRCISTDADALTPSRVGKLWQERRQVGKVDERWLSMQGCSSRHVTRWVMALSASFIDSWITSLSDATQCLTYEDGLSTSERNVERNPNPNLTLISNPNLIPWERKTVVLSDWKRFSFWLDLHVARRAVSKLIDVWEHCVFYFHTNLLLRRTIWHENVYVFIFMRCTLNLSYNRLFTKLDCILQC